MEYQSDKTDERVETFLAEADAKLADISRAREEIAARRRQLAEPSHKLVVANPTELHHKIALGGVMVKFGLSAADANALAGLLAMPTAQFAEMVKTEAEAEPDLPAGNIITRLIDRKAAELEARGQYGTWLRRLEAYCEDKAEWLERDEEFRLKGEWRTLPMTSDQRWLIRVTCRALRIAMPGNLLRGEASDWLAAKGANLNYEDFA